MKILKEIIAITGPHEIVALISFLITLMVWAVILPDFLRAGCN